MSPVVAGPLWTVLLVAHHGGLGAQAALPRARTLADYRGMATRYRWLVLRLLA